MNRRTVAAVLITSALAVGCKDKAKPNEVAAAPGSGSGSVVAPPEPVSGSGSGAGPVAVAVDAAAPAATNASIADFADEGKLVLGAGEKLAPNGMVVTWTVGEDAGVLAVVYAKKQARVVAFDTKYQVVEIKNAEFTLPYDPDDGSIRFIPNGDKLVVRYNWTSGNVPGDGAEALLLIRDDGFAPTYPGGIHVETTWKGGADERAPFEPAS